MNPTTADKLHDILTRQYAAHEELLRVLQQQQQAIRACDAAALERLKDRCDAVAHRIHELEAARVSVTGPGVKVAQLAMTLPEPQQSRLAAIAAGLRKLADQIASLNRVNSMAVSNMLDHFQTVYQKLAAANQASSYSAGGKPCGQKRSAPFLVDAVA